MDIWSYVSIPILPVDMSWPFPNLNRPHKLWTMGSRFMIPAVGVFGTVFLKWLNNFAIYNKETLVNALENRPKEKPLITVSNHYSCADAPLLTGERILSSWFSRRLKITGMLDFRHFFNTRTSGWNLGAKDICFSNELHALIFSLVRTVPIIRGHGVYQKAIDFVLDRLNNGEWLHVFPEGKVNMTKEFLQFKWGVGRLIADCSVCPIVLPLFHLGMDEVLPNDPPYYPRLKKKVTILVGKPMLHLEELVQELKLTKTAVQQRKIITDTIQKEVWNLYDETRSLHMSR